MSLPAIGKATSCNVLSYASVVAFESMMKKSNRPCTLISYEKAGHGFFNTAQYFDKTIAEADRFLVDLGWIKK